MRRRTRLRRNARRRYTRHSVRCQADTCACRLDWFEREILRFVVVWAPHGKLWDEDVYPMFGMRAEQLVDRFRSIVAALVPRLDHVAQSDRELLDTACHLLRTLGQAR